MSASGRSPGRLRAARLCLAVAAGAVAVGAVPPGPAVAAPAGPCQPGVGIRLLEAPTGTRDPRALSYVIDHVQPGARFTRRFEVCNGTRDRLALSFYANAATIRDGQFAVTEGRAANELTGWVTVSPAAATLAPDQRVVLTAAFSVPAEATGGERYGVVLVELPPRAAATGLAVANRVGLRLYLDVGGPRAPLSDFRIDSLQAGRDRTGVPVVTAQVRNTGERALDMTGSLVLRDGPGGLSGGPFPATLGTTLAPGQAEPVRVVLDRAISGGPWTAVLTLRSGLLERRAEAPVVFPDAAGAQAPPVQAAALPFRDRNRLAIWTAVGLSGLLAVLLLLAALLASRRRGRRAAQ